ncbi:hypothetical protein I79_009662 [Cricetulus griseus]|uniref:Uncharacterized protein n=1 Tax=Cricetulus griseus TaxID=10029 RepID=G3HGD8_CRIGR|nr:hypothetical protein I79_009662 [Cricetulus griseus]
MTEGLQADHKRNIQAFEQPLELFRGLASTPKWSSVPYFFLILNFSTYRLDKDLPNGQKMANSFLSVFHPSEFKH